MMAKECGEWFPLFDGDGDSMPAMEHDAAYAHALVQSIRTHMNIYTDKSRMDLMEVTMRADELMKEWGYTDD